MRKDSDFHHQDPTWCRGCGLYALFAAFKKTMADMDMDPEHLVVVTGIGCHGRFNNYIRSYGFHTLHGRALPVAQAVRLANSRLTVVAISGDGDAYSIGLGHFIHAVRRNVNMLYIVVDNRLYALTQGQSSPTSAQGYVSRSQPFGTKEHPLNGPQLALDAGGAFIARGFAGDPGQLGRLIEQGIGHNGFALLEVLSPCVTHNKVVTYSWIKERLVNLDDVDGFRPDDRDEAWARLNTPDRTVTGLIYRGERSSYDDLALPGRVPLVEADLPGGLEKMSTVFDDFK